MGRAMNRSIGNVLFGRSARCKRAALPRTTTGAASIVTTAEDLAIMLAYARKVVFVPGYGLAVAQAQHTVRALAELLEQKGIDVLCRIHSVAGRMPGHMNVLLAEADVPYDQLKEMDEINPELPQTDVVVILGSTTSSTRPRAPTRAARSAGCRSSTSIAPAPSSSSSTRSAPASRESTTRSSTTRTSMLFADAKQALEDVSATLKAL